MPLSEHEQKLLDQMERALYAEDPSFASQMKGHVRSTSRARIVTGVLVAVLGLVVVLLGVNAASIPLGIVGFVIMVAGVVWAANPRRHAAVPVAGAQAPRAKKGGAPRPRNASFMQRMDDRWDRRRRDGGY